jgi:hypothetical protein
MEYNGNDIWWVMSGYLVDSEERCQGAMPVPIYNKT